MSVLSEAGPTRITPISCTSHGLCSSIKLSFGSGSEADVLAASFSSVFWSLENDTLRFAARALSCRCSEEGGNHQLLTAPPHPCLPGADPRSSSWWGM